MTSPIPVVHAGDVITLTHRGDPTKPPRTLVVHQHRHCYLTLDRIAQHVNTICPGCVHRWWTMYIIAVHDWWPAGKNFG